MFLIRLYLSLSDYILQHISHLSLFNCTSCLRCLYTRQQLSLLESLPHFLYQVSSLSRKVRDCLVQMIPTISDECNFYEEIDVHTQLKIYCDKYIFFVLQVSLSASNNFIYKVTNLRKDQWSNVIAGMKKKKSSIDLLKKTHTQCCNTLAPPSTAQTKSRTI